MNTVISAAVIAGIVVFVVCLLSYVIYKSSYNIYKKNVIDMNRRIFKYKEDGWMILVNVDKKVVGLYHDHHSISHDRIYLGKSMYEMMSGDEVRLIIEDFHRLDVDVPRLSYRILYEYQVPFSTPVILYRQ